jgi:hypothetical protein
MRTRSPITFRLWLALLIGIAALAGCGGSASGPSGGAGGSSGGGTTGSSGNTGPNSVLSGKYAFSFTGTATSTGNPLLFAGSFTADGAGNITAGVEDLDEISIGISKGLALSGNYSIGSDGRGTLNFISVSQTFKIVIENGGHGQLIRFDSGAAGYGSFDLQSASAFSLNSLQGQFVFSWNGSDSGLNPFSGIGTFSLSGGAASGAADLNDGGTYTQGSISGTLQPPDGNGHGTASITYGTTAVSYGYDIISASRILLVETDAIAATVGEADLQSATVSSSLLSGNYVFFLNGISQVFAMEGQFVADGQGNIASSDVTENNGNVLEAPFVGTPSYAAANTVQGIPVAGRLLFTATEPTGLVDNFVVYRISPSQAMIMETDSDQLTFGEIITQGVGPFSPASLNGNYGFNFTGIDGNQFESDFVGQIVSGGTSTLTGGTIDINDEDTALVNPSTIPNSAITAGSYSVINGTTGHGTLTFAAANVSFVFSIYFVSPSQIFMVQTDNQAFLSVGSAQTQPTIPN